VNGRMKTRTLLLVLTFASTSSVVLRGQTLLDVEVTQSNGLLSAQFDVPDGNPSHHLL